jgi:hypothetical protein
VYVYDDEEKKSWEAENITFEVSKVSYNGDFHIKFSELMIDEGSKFNMSYLNSSNIMVNVTEFESGDNQNLTWKPVSFIDDIVKFKLRFKYPLNVSKDMDESGQLDRIRVEIINTTIFTCRTNPSMRFNLNELEQFNGVPKQLAYESFSQSFQGRS